MPAALLQTVSESLWARGRLTNPARASISPKDCQYKLSRASRADLVLMYEGHGANKQDSEKNR